MSALGKYFLFGAGWIALTLISNIFGWTWLIRVTAVGIGFLIAQIGFAMLYAFWGYIQIQMNPSLHESRPFINFALGLTAPLWIFTATYQYIKRKLK